MKRPNHHNPRNRRGVLRSQWDERQPDPVEQGEQFPSESPLVSCIMPTANRPGFVPLAIRRFLEQNYPRKELVIVDDGHQSVEELIPDHPDIYYFRHPGGITLGEKRNWAIRQTRGSILLHWDDDDWTHPGWITFQVAWLLATGADVVGLEQVYFYDPVYNGAWQYIYPQHLEPWVHGATMCYRRKLWEENPFPPLNVGEDCRFLWSNVPKKIAPHESRELFVATVHATNASAKQIKDNRWHPLPLNQITDLMGGDSKVLKEIALNRMVR